MKNYTITVNGNVYDVTVEEKSAVSMSQNPSFNTPSAVSRLHSTPDAVRQEVSRMPPNESKTGSVQIKAGAAGKVVKIEATVGQHVRAGDTIVIIEAMKMEIPIVTPETGTITSIAVEAGKAIDAGAVLATLN
jgi:biotin carboxyl carrier protein